MSARKLVYTALLAALTAAGAFIRIPIGISVITLQFLFTAMAGVLLGPGGGALSQGVYVALGLVGLPIFTAGGGFGYVLQPSFGFLLGLIPTAAVIGGLSRRSSSPVTLDETLHTLDPELSFGVSPAGIWANKSENPRGSNTHGQSSYSELYCDSLEWIRRGTVDYICPQLYWAIGYKAADFETLVHWSSSVVCRRSVRLLNSAAIWPISSVPLIWARWL